MDSKQILDREREREAKKWRRVVLEVTELTTKNMLFSLRK